MNFSVFLSGFFFLLIIIILIIASEKYGYEIVSKLDPVAKLQSISKDHKKFQTSILLVLIEHGIIIVLAIMMLIAFGHYNIILGIIWTISRIGEGAIQIYYKKTYWGLINIARKYSNAGAEEQKSLSNSTLNILKTKNSIFQFSQLLFSSGTISYSILFVIYGIELPIIIIGWFGIVAGILYGFGNGIKLKKSDFEVLWNIGGLLIFIFELILGVLLVIWSFFL